MEQILNYLDYLFLLQFQKSWLGKVENSERYYRINNLEK